MSRLSAILIAFGALSAGSGFATASVDRAGALDAAAKLGMRSDANSLAAAAALTFFAGAQPDALELALRAGEAAPQSAVIGWMRLRLCAASPPCDFRDAATVLRWIDADNGASWLPLLAAAQKDLDVTEVDRIIGDMARAQHFDLYGNRVVVLLCDALRRVRSTLPRDAASDAGRLALAKELSAAQFIPSLGPVAEACRPAIARAERRDACIKLARIMQHGDLVAVQLAGYSAERRLIGDGREARNLAERRRLLEWRVLASAQVESPLLPWMKNARARQLLARMRSVPREEDVCVAVLHEHNRSAEPPEYHR